MGHCNKILWILALAFMVLRGASAPAAELVIGFTGPLSGPAAEYGQDCANGIDMAIKELNAAGGIKADGQKWTFRLERMDDKVSPFLTTANARKLVEKNALAIFNPVSTTTAALLKINEEKCGEFIVMGYTGSSKVTELKNRLLVVFTPLLTVEAQVYAEMAWARGWRKAAMVVTFGDYGDEWRQAFKANWEKMGGKITADKAVNYYTRTDFVEPLKSALATKPDVMLIGGPSGTTALVIEQARNMGYKGGFLVLGQAKLEDLSQMLLGTKMMENTIGSATVQSIPIPSAKEFDKKYRAQYKKNNTWEAVFHYTAMHALARAVAAAGSQDNVYAVRAAFSRIMPILGDKYPVEMHGLSDAGRVYITTAYQSVKDGKFTPADLYVWWLRNQADVELVKKAGKYHGMTLKPLVLKIGKID